MFHANMKNKLTRGLYDPHNGKPPFWVYGYYTHVAGDAIFPERHIIHTDVGLIDVDPKTVGECVAKDKHGHDVYEGDALGEDDADGVYVVYYNKKYMRWSARHTYGFSVDLSQLIPPPKEKGQPQPDYLDAVVVGNIHENPELGEIHKKEY